MCDCQNRCESKKGCRGKQGPPGPPGLWVYGPTGPKGDTGPQGKIGPMGDTGPKGRKGPTGDTGPQGNIGPSGTQGNIGPSGTQGNIGPSGPQGIEGPTGPQGIEGPTGSNGITSDTGWFFVSNKSVYGVVLSFTNILPKFQILFSTFSEPTTDNIYDITSQGINSTFINSYSIKFNTDGYNIYTGNTYVAITCVHTSSNIYTLQLDGYYRVITFT